MTLLTDNELADIQAEAERALPSLCTIQVPTQTNVKGSVGLSFANTYTDVPCRIMARNRVNQERDIGTALTGVADFVLTVPYDQALEPEYRVVCDGLTYEIVSVDNRQASWRSVRRASLRLLG